MATRYNMELPDKLNEELNQVSESAQISKAEIVRKALQLFFAAHKANERGDRVGIVDRSTNELKTEFIGL